MVFQQKYEFLFKFADKLHSVFESEEFELEKSYYRVEPTLDCHQKESVQVRNDILILISI